MVFYYIRQQFYCVYKKLILYSNNVTIFVSVKGLCFYLRSNHLSGPTQNLFQGHMMKVFQDNVCEQVSRLQITAFVTLILLLSKQSVGEVCAYQKHYISLQRFQLMLSRIFKMTKRERVRMDNSIIRKYLQQWKVFCLRKCSIKLFL